MPNESEIDGETRCCFEWLADGFDCENVLWTTDLRIVTQQLDHGWTSDHVLMLLATKSVSDAELMQLGLVGEDGSIQEAGEPAVSFV